MIVKVSVSNGTDWLWPIDGGFHAADGLFYT